MIDKKLLQKLVKKIENIQTFAIFGHDNPDGDAIGSMLGLGTLLEKQGKKGSYFAYPSISSSFNSLKGIQKIKTEFDYGQYDIIIFVDFSDYPRTYFTYGQEAYFDKQDILVFDHHIGPTPPQALVIKDESADSNCEWIFENTKEIRSEFYDEEIASYLYMGLLTDTANFHHDKQGSRSLHNAAELVDLGAKKQWLTQHFFGTLKYEQLEFFQQVLPRLVTNEDGIAYIIYAREDYEKLGIEKAEASGFLTSMITKIIGLRLILIARYDEVSIKISFRSKDPSLSAEAIARSQGGGGHFYAAGAKIMLEHGQNPQGVVADLVKKIPDILASEQKEH